MSDISGALDAAVSAALEADAGVIGAFGSAAVQIFDLTPVNEPEPYLVLGDVTILPLYADGFDLSEVDYPVHVWSRPNPPSMDEARALAAAVRACMLEVRPAAGGVVYDALPVRTEYFVDPSDNRTIHAIVTTRFTTAPAQPAS